MEFFDWLGIPQIIFQFMSVNCETPQEVVRALANELYISLGVAAGLFLIGQIFCGIGLYTIAKREGIKYPWLGFLPVACTYLSGKIAGEASFFGQKMKRAGLYASIVEVLYIAFNIFMLVLNFLTLDPAFYFFTSITEDGSGIWQLNQAQMGGLGWIYDVLYLYGDIINSLVWFLLVVFLFVLYTAFFRKYYARGPVLMTFFCVVLPVRGFCIFAVRNNPAVDYQDYMRRRMEDYTRRNAPYGGYGNYPNYPNSPNYPPQGGGDNPFSDFGPQGGGGGDGGNNGNGGNSGNSGSGGGSGDNPFSDF